MRVDILFVCRPNWIYIYGIDSSGFQPDGLPISSKIVDIIVLAESIPLLQIDTYKTWGINNHLSAFQNSRTSTNTVILPSQLHNKDKYYAHSNPGDSHTYITMKSLVANIFV